VDLFSRIATQQREPAPALKPVLPPRFAARPLGEAPWTDDTLEAAALPASSAALAAVDDAPAGPEPRPVAMSERPAVGSPHDAKVPKIAQPALRSVAPPSAAQRSLADYLRGEGHKP
jgi:hypothetical protein